jgi:hypothetical protein
MGFFPQCLSSGIFLLRQGLTRQPKQASKSWPSCLGLPSAGIITCTTMPSCPVVFFRTISFISIFPHPGRLRLTLTQAISVTFMKRRKMIGGKRDVQFLPKCKEQSIVSCLWRSSLIHWLIPSRFPLLWGFQFLTCIQHDLLYWDTKCVVVKGQKASVGGCELLQSSTWLHTLMVSSA